jgi:hypothetical protein
MPATPRAPEIKKVPELESLANANETIHVRNTTDGIAVFTLRVNGNDEISEFAAKGDPEGNDVMALPSSYLKNGQFQKQLKKEIFEIIDADNADVVIAFQAQKDAWKAQQATKAESDRLVEQNAPKAFAGRQCLANDNGRQCSEYAVFAANNYRERPPLCSKHSHLSAQFIAEETGQFKDNKPIIDWVRVSQVRT